MKAPILTPSQLAGVAGHVIEECNKYNPKRAIDLVQVYRIANENALMTVAPQPPYNAYDVDMLLANTGSPS